MTDDAVIEEEFPAHVTSVLQSSESCPNHTSVGGAVGRRCVMARRKKKWVDDDPWPVVTCEACGEVSVGEYAYCPMCGDDWRPLSEREDA